MLDDEFGSPILAAIMAFSLAFIGPAHAKVEGDIITLGAAISFTGKNSAEGTHASNGYNLAVKMINAQGGIRVGGKSYKIRIKYYDDESTPSRTARLGEKLIEQDGVKFFLGPNSAPTTKAMVSVAEKFKAPMVGAAGAAQSFFTRDFRYVFAVHSTSEQYLAAVIDLAAKIAKNNGKSVGALKIAMIFANDPFSFEVRAGVLDAAKKHNMKIIIDEKLSHNQTKMAATLEDVRTLHPDILLISGQSQGAEIAARQIRELRINTPMIAMTHCEAAQIIRKFGPSTNGFLCPTQWSETLSHRGETFGTALDYAALFKKAHKGYKHVPDLAAQATAAIIVWKDAFERADSFDTDKLRAALATTDLKTFYGHIKFSPVGINIAKPLFLQQIQDGKLKIVAPLKWASDPVQHPRKPAL